MVFFLSNKMDSLESRIQRITPLLKLFTTEQNHVVQQYANTKETKAKPALWNGYQVILHYQPVIPCESMELEQEFWDASPVFCKLWIQVWEDTHKKNQKPKQLHVLTKFLGGPNNGVQFTNVCQLIKLMIATPCHTSSVERGYSYLEMICSPWKNSLKPEHLETLFLLATLKIPVKESHDYSKEMELLENS